MFDYHPVFEKFSSCIPFSKYSSANIFVFHTLQYPPKGTDFEFQINLYKKRNGILANTKISFLSML